MQIEAEIIEAGADTASAAPALSPEQRRIALIQKVIDEVRPNLTRDGGDCQLVGIEGNKVMVRLTGACVLCKLSSATLEGIQAKVIEKLGEFVRLVPVGGPSAPVGLKPRLA